MIKSNEKTNALLYKLPFSEKHDTNYFVLVFHNMVI